MKNNPGFLKDRPKAFFPKYPTEKNNCSTCTIKCIINNQ